MIHHTNRYFKNLLDIILGRRKNYFCETIPLHCRTCSMQLCIPTNNSAIRLWATNTCVHTNFTTMIFIDLKCKHKVKIILCDHINLYKISHIIYIHSPKSQYNILMNQISNTIYSWAVCNTLAHPRPTSRGGFKQRPGEAVKLTETFSN